EVEHHDAEAGAGAVAPGERALEVLVERTMVAEPSEAIGERGLLEPNQLVPARPLEPPPVAGEPQEEDGAAREADDDQQADRRERGLLEGAVRPGVRGAAVDVGEEARERRVERRGASVELTGFTGGRGVTAGEVGGGEPKICEEERVTSANEARAHSVVPGA